MKVLSILAECRFFRRFPPHTVYFAGPCQIGQIRYQSGQNYYR